MKKVLLCSMMFCLAFTAFGQQKQAGEKLEIAPTQVNLEENTLIDDTEQTKDIPVMTFTEQVYEFGTITSGEKVEHVFKFTNTGTTPLVIKGAKSSCGCTVPRFPKDAVLPGQSAEISVVFNSKGKSGQQNKPIRITANTDPEITTLYIKGMVERAK